MGLEIRCLLSTVYFLLSTVYFPFHSTLFSKKPYNRAEKDHSTPMDETMNKDLILAIDNGTQSVRALIFDLRGNLLLKSRVALKSHDSPQPGWSEQRPGYYWESLCQACRQLNLTPEIRDRIAGLTLTTQRNTMINVDREGSPLRPAIVWPDQRRTEGLPPIQGFWRVLFTLAGMMETSAYLQAEAEVNWLRTHQPEIWQQTHKYLFLSGYLLYHMTGKFIDSVGSQVGYLPFDYKDLRWSKSWDWKWQIVPVELEKLPELAPPASQLGELTPKAAAEMGLPAGLPIIAAAADKACEVIGAGCLEPHLGCLSYGTAATINVTHSKYIEPIPLIPPYPSAVPNAYSMEIQIYRGYWLVSWFKQEFGLREQKLAEEQGIEPEAFFDDLVRQVPAGSDGLMLQPYWSPGVKIPGPEARGAIIGFNDSHTRAHIYRAILEGLGYALRESKERIEERTHVPITALRVAGGGSQSDAAMQITADIFGLPTSRPHLYEASGLGAAIDAAVGLKLHPDFATAIREMTRTGRTFEPNPHSHAIYDGLYREVYRGMYPHLKPLYKKIRKLTR